MTRALTHVLIFCSDLGRMAEFYGNVFAMRREGDDAEFVMLRGAGADIALHQVPAHLVETIARPPVVREDSWCKLCFGVNDVEAAKQAVIAQGGTANKDWSWQGTAFCECSDVEGNVIQLYQRWARADDAADEKPGVS